MGPQVEEVASYNQKARRAEGTVEPSAIDYSSFGVHPSDHEPEEQPHKGE